jgi:hypothetical protein
MNVTDIKAVARPRRRRNWPLTNPTSPGALYRAEMDAHDFHTTNGLRSAWGGDGNRPEREAAAMRRTREHLRSLASARRDYQAAMVLPSMERRPTSWRLAR